MAMAPGAALLGIDARWNTPMPNTFPLLRSADGGATWQALPDLPSAMQINALVFETPDGTVYLTATGLNAGEGGIYKLSPGASPWKLVSAVTPGDLRMMAVTWDANGHPATLWGLTQAHPNTSSAETLLWAHTA